MMRAARIENGVVADLWEVPSLDCYGDLYTLVEAPEWVQLGDTYSNGSFTPKPKPIEQAKAEKLAELDRAYDAAIQQAITYMGHTFQSDTNSQDTLTKTLTTLNAVGNVPTGFAWWAADNIAVPMTLAELNGLAMAMLNQGWVAFQNKQAKKAAVRNAQTVDDVNSVVW
jgi:hypothetical protein